MATAPAKNASVEEEVDRGKLAYELIAAKVKEHSGSWDPSMPAYPIKSAAREISESRSDNWTPGAISQAFYNYIGRPAVRRQLGLPPKDEVRTGRAKSAVRPTAMRVIETDEVTESVDRLLNDRISLMESFLHQMRASDEAIRAALSDMVVSARTREESFAAREQELNERSMKVRELDAMIQKIVGSV